MGKKDKKKELKKAPSVKLTGPPPKPKKIPNPPAFFTKDDLIRYKEIFKLFDEDNIDKVSIECITVMLRKLGFNPKTAEVNELFRMFLEDELVDTVELHEWYQMIEAKMGWGDDFEQAIVTSIQSLGHDDDVTGFVDLEVLRQELMQWGEPLAENEFADWIRMCVRDKTYNPETGALCYLKFVESMNGKDMRYFKEPVNYFKLDQKTLAAMAIQKAEEAKAEAEKKEADKRAREEARRQKLIADGLLAAD